jgi:hypothetical protein
MQRQRLAHHLCHHLLARLLHPEWGERRLLVLPRHRDRERLGGLLHRLGLLGHLRHDLGLNHHLDLAVDTLHVRTFSTR